MNSLHLFVVAFATIIEKLGIVKREALNEPYRPVAYSLTEKGKKLTSILRELENL
jgi:DNA-binding HxlR family transcriptional regulator